MRLPRAIVLVGLLALLTLPVSAADEQAPAASDLDPRGRPDESLVKQPRRYYVWHDAEGWHLRSAAQGTIKFEGVVRVVGGQFRKFRPVGLDVKGKLPDRWVLDAKRQELKFLMHTSTRVDGFDFDVDGSATEIGFDLTMAGAKAPKRIFIGRKAVHPAEATFSLPAHPDTESAPATPAKP